MSENPVVGPRASGFGTGKDGEAGDIGVYRRYSRTQSSLKISRSKPDRILRQAPKGRTAVLAVVGALLAVEILASFLWPLSQQIAFVRNPSTRLPTVAIAGTAAGLFFLLFFLFKERFSIRACPYGLIQMVIQGPNTRQMQFHDPENTCIHCGLCDNSCPMNLDAKNECDSLRCTGCGLCQKACESVLGAEDGLFRMSLPKDSEV